MIQRVTLADCAAKVADFLESRLTHEQLVEWAREAMLAEDMPPLEHQTIMDLLLDISISTPKSLAQAAKNYRLMTSPLARGTPMDPRRN